MSHFVGRRRPEQGLEGEEREERGERDQEEEGGEGGEEVRENDAGYQTMILFWWPVKFSLFPTLIKMLCFTTANARISAGKLLSLFRVCAALK